MRRLVRWWVFWLLVVWFVSFPWIGFTAEPQWHRIHWVPFSDPADKFRDIAANILLFLPLGFAVTRRRDWRSGLLMAGVIAGLVSISAEAMQLFSTKRHPSATDVTAGIFGAVVGGITTIGLRTPSKPETWTD
jgi:glycopeptide antibiotics resistance protein